MPFVYILRCSDDSYYVGSTRNLDHRMEQHASGAGSSYTGKRLPVTLVFAEEYNRIDEAYAREKQIQGWSRRKREALIRGEYQRLPKMSERGSRVQP
ncbi:GIY-YIG nuclease family protein [Microbacterium sp. STN6]|uniref:GIY-YIG nuclease family protein n=1 Tax=Microbacterium sp. STN6 TaxID=2995588 RepID=UPI002260ADB8|nr:GIY-YIG nuclease family protein [Microbacterium sp. STN6]MCX7523172.1 GIY-YIG nuclease family protein [Microbacterium sp. STN6]